MVPPFHEQHREVRGARGEIAQVSRAQNVHCRRKRVAHCRVRRIGHAVSKINQRKERVLLTTSVERSAPFGALMEPRPHLERLPPYGHVAAGTYATEPTDLEPVRVRSIDRQCRLAVVCGAANTREQLLGLCLDLQWDRSSTCAHYHIVVELAGETGEPARLGDSIVIEVRDDVRAGHERAAVTGAAKSSLWLNDVTRSPALRDPARFGIAVGVVDNDDVEIRIVLCRNCCKTAVKLRRTAASRNDDRARMLDPIFLNQRQRVCQRAGSPAALRRAKSRRTLLAGGVPQRYRWLRRAQS
jgi:hypothetical protein